jgi:hypothetical protein
MLIVCMPRIKLSYIQPECEHRKAMSLLYKLYYTRYYLYTEEYIDSLIKQHQNNPTPQAINWGQRKLLEEILIVVVFLISIFRVLLQQG